MTSNYLNKLIKLFLVLLLFITLYKNIEAALVPSDYNHYYLLAKSFLQHKLFFAELPHKLGDTVLYHGRYYWPNPPLPAVVMMPFILVFSWFGIVFYQSYLNLLVQMGLIIVLYKLFKTSGAKNDVYYWIYGFLSCTPFLFVALTPYSWYLAHVLVVFLIFFAYLLHKKGASMVYIGLIFGLVALTRFTAAVGIVYYVLLLVVDNLLEKKDLRGLVNNLLKLILPFLALLLIMFSYNYARYNTWKEIGYPQNNLIPPHQEARNYGVFSLKHLPGNLYYLLLRSPEPVFVEGVSHVLASPYVRADLWGLSIFITSPFLLLLFTFQYKSRNCILLLVTAAIISIPILLYFGLGYVQFGYRYALDFLPYLYILFVSEYVEKNKTLSNRLKLLFILVSLSNLYLVANLH